MILKLFKNSIFLALAGIVEKAALVILYYILARKLTQVEFGEYSLVLTCIYMGVVIADFGIEPVLVREIAKQKERAAMFFRNAISMSLLFSVMIWPVVIFAAGFLRYDPEVVFLIKIAGASFIFFGISKVSSAVIKAFERMDIIAYVSFFQAVLNVFLCSAVLWAGMGVLGLIIVLLAVEAIRGIILVLIVHKFFVPVGFRLDKDIVFQVLRQSVPFAVLMAHSILHRKVDILIMGRLTPLSDVAIYGAAVKLADFLSLLSSSMVGALFPAFSVLAHLSKEKMWRGYIDSISVFVILGFFAATIITVLAKPITVLFFGQSYAFAAVPLIWLGWAFFFSMLGGPIGVIMISEGNQMRNLLLLCWITIGINIVLNIWLIPIYSYNGAAMATFVSTLIGFVGNLFLIDKIFKKTPDFFKIIRWPAVAALFTGVILKSLFFLHVIVLLFVGIIIYFCGLYFCGEFSHERYAPLAAKFKIARRR
jgi:O-antigen/teichoic acid export membrane protein